MNLSVFNFKEGYPFALVSFEKHLNYSLVADELYNNHRQDLGQVEALIVRPPVERPIDSIATEQQTCKMLLERFPYLQIHLLYSNNFAWDISDNLQKELGTDAFAYSKGEFLQFCRQRELEDFVLHSQAIYKSPQQSVFRTPSQEYTNAFLRVGNIQNRRHVLDTIFFWLLPYLRDAGALLTDSWSISSISLNVGRLYGRYMQYLRGAAQEDKFHVNFLTTFYHGKAEMSKETCQALQPLLYANDKKILFLLSAVKTQKSLDNLRWEMERQGFLDNVNFIALYALQQELDVDRLCPLYDPPFLKNAGLPKGFESLPDPPEGKTVVVIEEKTFFPSEPKVRELALKKDLAEESLAFFERYMGSGALSVHRNAYFTNNTIQRHHGLFIDVTVLLEERTFQESLRQKVDALPALPALLIYPPHPQGAIFVGHIQRLLKIRFGETIPVYCFADLDTLAVPLRIEIKAALTTLDQQATILVVDDVLTTGNRLRSYQKCLRELPYEGRIFYLVGVARPQAKKDLDFLKRDLQHRIRSPRHSLQYIEQVFLPDWTKETCPWCRESHQLEVLAEEDGWVDAALQRILIDRQILLSGKVQSGLTDEVFYSVRGTEKARFSGGSIFCVTPAITEAELVARIAAAIHHYKTEGLTGPEGLVKLGVDYPLYSIIRSDDYLGDTFNEALIKASILRSCGAKELYAVEDTHLQKQKAMILALLAEGKLKAPECCFFYYELFLAIRSFKLPAPTMTKSWQAMLLEPPGQGD